MDKLEKRASDRYKVQIKVQLLIANQTHECEGIDLSLGGIRLYSKNESIKTDTECTLKFTIPESDEVVEIDGVVRWVDTIYQNMMGIQFLEGLSAKQTWLITNLGQAL